jgi:outer membrane protein TolC
MSKTMKMTIGKRMLAMALALTAITTAQAQEAKTLELDLPAALELALSDNPVIKVADMEIERYDYVRRETMGNLLPSLSAGGRYNFNIVKQEMAKGMSFGADMDASAALDLSIPLFVPSVYTALKMNRTQQALAVEQARSSKLELTNAVKKAFFQVLLLEKSYEVLLSSETTIRETVDNTGAMYTAGLASEYDLLTAEVQLSNLGPSIISTRNGVAVVKQMLKMYLNIPEEVEISVSGSLDDYRDALHVLPDVSADVENNSELRQLDFQQTLLRQQIRLTNMGRLPVLAAYGNLSVSGQDKTMGFGLVDDGMGIVSTNKWWWQHPASAGLQISIPIFSGLKNSSKVRQLRNQVSQVELQRDYLRRAKELEANTAMNTLLTARETMLSNEITVTQAEKAYSISKTRFEAGAGTMLEVNQAELSVTQARLNHSQAIFDYLAAQADYDKVIGKEPSAE